MHRLLLSAAVLALITVPSVGLAQPPWPAGTMQPASNLGPETAPSSTAQAPRRITPRPASARAQQASDRNSAARGTPSPWTAFVSLAVIVAVIVAAARLWKKHGPPIGGGLPADALEVLGRRPLDRRNAIQIVRCGSRILILGVGEEGLRTLTEITDAAEVDYLTAICRRGESDQHNGPGFLGLLRRSPAERSVDEPQVHGRVDEVLTQRFPQTSAAPGTAGSPVHA